MRVVDFLLFIYAIYTLIYTRMFIYLIDIHMKLWFTHLHIMGVCECVCVCVKLC